MNRQLNTFKKDRVDRRQVTSGAAVRYPRSAREPLPLAWLAAVVGIFGLPAQEVMYPFINNDSTGHPAC